MKKVIVKANTNIRLSCEDLSISPIGLMLEGAQFEVEDDLVNGASHTDEATGKTASTWYKDANGWFYWSGEIEPVQTPSNPPTDFDVAWDYRKKLHNLPSEWMESFGAGVKIAILDSGLFLRSNFKNIKADQCFNCLTDELSNDISGFGPHGTAVTTFLASWPDSENGIRGVVPEADFYFMKMYDDGGNVSEKTFVRALNLAIEKEVDIITMSQGLSFAGQETQALKDAYSQLIAKNILFICAGNTPDDPLHILYPASEFNTLSIGTMEASDMNLIGPTETDLLNLIFPSLLIRTYWSENGGFGESHCTSSFAAPMLAGVVALLFAHLKKQAQANNQTFQRPALEILKTELQNLPLTAPLETSSFSTFIIIDPKKVAL